ncbi:hypothetical protein EZV62_026328 [Acer yangbiense]|uniref:F-box domain-containing protein n=1 Tax=Acer yangbiense TaxID=1000413 RepID=A0A5C7GQH0_9ROSI|nr:hypothetical protein EZV62_026328 [Acer yangbiense]
MYTLLWTLNYNCDIYDYELNVTDLKIMGDRIGMVDRISELPDFIIHHIMSYLSTKEVAQTCVLSKRWNHLRTSFPILDFDQVYFLGDLAKHSMYTFSVREKRRFCKRSVKFVGFVDASLLRFCELKVSMQKFRLSMRLFDVEGITSLLDKWIELAVANEVQELDFNVETNGVSRYSLPATIFSAKFVTTLKLSGCKLEQSSDTIRFHSLKKLALHSVHIGEQMVQKFISECPLLEDLILSAIGFKRVCVSNAPKLKIVTIGDENNELESIEIVAPSLQQCTLTCLYKPCVIDLAGCPHLNSLKLVEVDIEIHDLISKIPLLEKLIIQDCDEITEIVFSSNRLKDLQILQCYNMNGINVDAPNLLSFSLECEDILYCFSINGSHRCSCKLKFIIKFDTEGDILVLTWFNIIKEEFLGVAHQVKELSMSISIDKRISLDSFSLDEFRNCSLSLPREVENLIIDVQEVPPSKYAALLDCLLWVCFPRILSIELKQQKQSIKFIEVSHVLFYLQLFYEKLINSDTKCCNSHIIKCWRHYLKGYKIESFVPYNDPKPLRVDNLMVELPRLPEGTIRFQLEWCSFFTY